MLQPRATIAIYKAEQVEKIKWYTIAVLQDVMDVVNDCAISKKMMWRGLTKKMWLSYHILQTLISNSYYNNINSSLNAHQAKLVLHNTTSLYKVHLHMHYVPQRNAAYYKIQIEAQIQDMLYKGIIEEKCSLWLAPFVIILKKSGEIRLCIEYHQLNK